VLLNKKAGRTILHSLIILQT